MSHRSTEVQHMFSIELKYLDCLKRVAIPNRAGENVLIEGLLGELETVGIVEDVMLEIKGTNGIMRMDLREEELRKLLQSIDRSCATKERELCLAYLK